MTQALYNRSNSFSLTYSKNGHQIKCKGCQKSFRSIKLPNRYDIVAEVAYYVHCIEECADYKNLGLIRSCPKCPIKMLNSFGLGAHMKESHSQMFKKKPSWMLPMAYKKHCKYGFNDRVNCKGCGKSFLAKRLPKTKGRIKPAVHYELDYVIHSIERCPKYKKLGKFTLMASKWHNPLLINFTF